MHSPRLQCRYMFNKMIATSIGMLKAGSPVIVTEADTPKP